MEVQEVVQTLVVFHVSLCIPDSSGSFETFRYHYPSENSQRRRLFVEQDLKLSEDTKLSFYRSPDMSFCCYKHLILEDGDERGCLSAGGTTSTSSSMFPSPLEFAFFLPNFQNPQLHRPLVKQHMKARGRFSAALRTSLSAATGISCLGMGASEASRESTSTSSLTLRYVPLALLFPNLTVLSYPSFAGPWLSRTENLIPYRSFLLLQTSRFRDGGVGVCSSD
jgi:hypothetical protein